MTGEEQDTLIDYATRFGHAIGNRFERLRDDLVSASLHGVAIALASPDLPGDREGRRKFVGKAAWNMIRRELTFFLKKTQPVCFTDLADEYKTEFEVDVPIDAEHVARADWLDEYRSIAASLDGTSSEIFKLAFGDEGYTNVEISRQVGLAVSTTQYHLRKIRRAVRSRHEREERFG